MNIIKKSRRHFLKNSLISAAGASAYSLLSSCSSFDDYLFEDRYNFKDEVMIIGGGISGLYLAQQLRSNKTEFRLFEGSSVLGGRIKSNDSSDFGPSFFSEKDRRVNKLLTDLCLQKKPLEKDFFYLDEGMQSITEALSERILGLIPYRNLRLRWKLIEISKLSTGFEMVFENPSGQKKFVAKKLALTIPPTQWESVKGLLDLPEMSWGREWLSSMKVQNTIKLVLPLSAIPSGSKPITATTVDNLNIRQIIKRNKTPSTVEIEVQYWTGRDVSIEYIYNVLKKKLQVNYPLQKITPEQYFDWNQPRLIKGSSYQNFIAVPESVNTNFQIVSDFTQVKAIYTVEGALESAEKAAKLFI
jgi:hypothetical protein